MRYGFTLIEVSLFLGITALLFVGITVGTQNSINQQRYSDTVNSFADFLRNVYSEVSNPQSNGRGNSDQAIYGKLVSFGQTYKLDEDGIRSNDDSSVFVYDVVGNVEGNYGDSILPDALKKNNASIVTFTDDKNSVNQNVRTFSAGMMETYTPRWQGRIETEEKNKLAKMNLLIVRHPKSGTIHTLVSWSDIDIDINSALKDIIAKKAIVTESGNCAITSDTCSVLLKNVNNLNASLKNSWDTYGYGDVNLCVNPFSDSAKRQNVRIIEDARNASGVEVIELDSDSNVCNK